MSDMTYARWQQIDKLQWEKARKEQPTGDLLKLRRKVTKAMVATHGKCPPKPGSKPPLKVRLGLWFVKRKLEDKMDGKKSSIPKWVLALAFGLTAAYSTFDLAWADKTIDLGEGLAIANAVIVAAIAKFSNPEKKLSPKPSVK